MNKLWQQKNKLNYKTKLVEQYCFQKGAYLDNELLPYDIYGSLAHVTMLAKIGIFNQNELKKVKKELIHTLNLWKNKKISITPEDEDVHTKIENILTNSLGELGKKIHTARSRNDQVLVDLRLYAKEQIFSIHVSINRLIDTFVNFAKKHEFVPMPGYTHMQKAMPSSLGMWAGSFAESLLDDLSLLKTAFILNDQSPLGTGAAYGVSLPIDRTLTTQLLSFNKIQNNSLYSQVSRPKIQLVVIQALSQIILTLSRFAQDLLLFTTSEFNFITVDSDLCTGSSIMPQKKNLDVMEYLRAKSHVMNGYVYIVASISSSLPSGYNADFAETKGPFMESFTMTMQSLEIVDLVVKSMKPNVDVLKKACTPELYATHQAYQLVKKGISFREAYEKVKKSLSHLDKYDPVQVLKETNHIGGPGNLGLDKIKKGAEKDTFWWNKQKLNYENVINQLLKQEQ